MQDFINGRCGWCGTDELYVKYHDEEWGKPVTDDKTLFEFLVLESAQAGLSWITILKKREGYRKAFCNFDAAQVAQMTDEDVERLMHFDGIVKNRLKIKSTITNAKQFLVIQKEFGSFLKEAIREADQALQETSEMDRKLALGEIDDLHSAMIQAEQSAAAVEFTTQLTSKAVSAYNQIMGMQV